VRTLPGLEDAHLVRHGYAVEYDYVPPTQLRATLETACVRGLYLAGQLNGTSGYEEAAFQGLVAGVNAALSAQGHSPLVLRRDEAHGGVLIDDLVTRGVDEPYRMLTARSEHRLVLREGNADLRLCRHGHRVGLVDEVAHRRTEARREAIEAELARLQRGPWAGWLRRPSESWASLADRDPDRSPLPAPVVEEVEVILKYEGYIQQHLRAAARDQESFDHWRLPATLPLDAIPGLSREAADKLRAYRPQTLGQARRIPGLTPTALSLLLIHLKRGGLLDGSG
jgi:tRNA uridine 5-carboxymethylaminomethyl modification enzyme